MKSKQKKRMLFIIILTARKGNPNGGHLEANPNANRVERVNMRQKLSSNRNPNRDSTKEKHNTHARRDDLHETLAAKPLLQN